MVIDSNGVEFGYELQLVVPYCYYLHNKGVDVSVNTSPGMSCFYYFLDEDKLNVKYPKRRWADSIHTPNKQPHVSQLDMTEWCMPDYRSEFKDVQLKTTFYKPLLLISNKFQTEWNGPPKNFLCMDTLLYIFNTLSEKYDIIYNRPGSDKIVEDHSDMHEFDDVSLLGQFDNVYDINMLHEIENIDFNLLQMILLARSEHKISVQGGNAVLCSLTGGTNVIYAIKGHELSCNSYNNWYDRFSDCKITHVDTYPKLINYCDTLLI